MTPIEEEEQINILKEYRELKQIEEEKNQLLQKIDHIMTELAKVMGEGQ